MSVISSELFRLFFEEASDALLALSLPDGKILGANRTFFELTGYGEEELQDENISILNSSVNEDLARERKLDLELINMAGFYNDIVLCTREGSVKFISVRVRHVNSNSQVLALAMLSDDTERQLLMRDLATKHQSLELAYLDLEKVHTQLQVSQEKMAQAAKLAALGELAAGLSHELNQPLTGIRGFAQEILDLLKDKKTSKKLVRKNSEEIVSNSDKMAKLLSHFRNFARREKHSFENPAEKTKLEQVDLVAVIESATTLLRRQLDQRGIQFESKIESSSAITLAEKHPIEQILINLLANGRDAIAESMVATDSKKSSRRAKLSVHVKTDDDWIYVRVRDSGSGVPEGIRTKIFDPFFTTKDPGKGTGLGLSISFGIAHRFDGELSLEETSSSGSCFLLKLKRYHSTSTQEAA